MANATAKSKTTLETTITVELSVGEAMALNEMTKYGITAFLAGYKKHLGQAYIEPHEKGLTKLFKTIGETLPHELRKVRELHAAIKEASVNFNNK